MWTNAHNSIVGESPRNRLVFLGSDILLYRVKTILYSIVMDSLENIRGSECCAIPHLACIDNQGERGVALFGTHQFVRTSAACYVF